MWDGDVKLVDFNFIDPQMAATHINTQNLGEFVAINDLRNNRGIIRFDADVQYEMLSGSHEVESLVGISFEGYDNAGTLIVYNEDLGPAYPIEFKAQYQDFVYDEKNNVLIITGNHPTLGKYSAVIRPL